MCANEENVKQLSYKQRYAQCILCCGYERNIQPSENHLLRRQSIRTQATRSPGLLVRHRVNPEVTFIKSSSSARPATRLKQPLSKPHWSKLHCFLKQRSLCTLNDRKNYEHTMPFIDAHFGDWNYHRSSVTKYHTGLVSNHIRNNCCL